MLSLRASGHPYLSIYGPQWECFASSCSLQDAIEDPYHNNFRGGWAQPPRKLLWILNCILKRARRIETQPSIPRALLIISIIFYSAYSSMPTAFSFSQSPIYWLAFAFSKQSSAHQSPPLPPGPSCIRILSSSDKHWCLASSLSCSIRFLFCTFRRL
jgi:hypothetical protein